jgi:hypothetical protein
MPVCTNSVTTHEAVIPVSVATLIPATVPDVPLYIRDSGEEALRLYRSGDHEVTAADISSLRSRGISNLYVAGHDYRKFQSYLRQNLDRLLDDESVPPNHRVGCLSEVVRDILADVFRQGDLENRIEQLKELGDKTVRAVCRDGIVFHELRSVLYHDYHTFTHSANVALYCVLLARELGIQDRADLSAIATGGLLHDAGKLEIPPGVLTKPGRLDEQETEIMRRHPTLGFCKLCRRQDLSLGQLMMVYQHHEQVDGGGYPVGHVGREIHDWGRLCAVVDVFEALTSSRPYRPGFAFHKACEMMMARSGASFDKEYLQCWMQFVSRK